MQLRALALVCSLTASDSRASSKLVPYKIKHQPLRQQEWHIGTPRSLVKMDYRSCNFGAHPRIHPNLRAPPIIGPSNLPSHLPSPAHPDPAWRGWQAEGHPSSYAEAPPQTTTRHSSIRNPIILGAMSEEPETDKPESPRRSTSSGSDGTKSRGRKAKHTGQRNPNPGIDVALRNLRDEVVGAGKLYQNFVGEFDTQVSAIADWADNYTIDTVWRNKVKAKVRNQEEGERLGGVLERLSSRRKSIVDALANAESVTPAWKDKHKLELQIRTAKKALVYSDGLIELARKALEERVSSRQLIQELNEASSLLEQKRHPWICESQLPAQLPWPMLTEVTQMGTGEMRVPRSVTRTRLTRARRRPRAAMTTHPKQRSRQMTQGQRAKAQWIMLLWTRMTTTGRLGKTRKGGRGGDVFGSRNPCFRGEVGARQLVFYAGFCH